MKILVTGKNGLVGSAIQRCSVNYPEHDFVFVGRKDADLTNEHDVEALFRLLKPDWVINTAAKVGGIGGNKIEPADMFRENTLMNTHIIHYAWKYNVQKLLAFSSVCVFPDGIPLLQEDLMHQGTPFHTQYAYGAAKRAIDIQITAYKEQYKENRQYCSIIPCNIFGTCFDEKTEVLTVSGIKNIVELKIGDEIYTLNPKTFKLEIAKIIKTQNITTNEWIVFRGKSVNFKVTPDHDMYTKYQGSNDFCKKKAIDFVDKKSGQATFAHHLPYDEISDQSTCKINLKKYSDKNHILINDNSVKDFNNSRSKIVPLEYDLKDLVELIGWYITEGSLGYIRKNQCQIIIAQSLARNPENCKEIDDLLTRMKICHGYNGKAFYFTSRLISNYLKKEVGNFSENKQIPEFIFKKNTSLHIRKILFETMMKGDGDKNKNRYTTNSPKLWEQFFHLSFLIGEKVNLGKDEVIKNYLPIKRIKIRNKKKHTTVKFKNIKREKLEKEEMSYCVTVDKNNIIFAGREGVFNWIYQCDYYNKSLGHVIPSLIYKIYEAMPHSDLTVWGDGSAKREFVYSEDLANIVLKILNLDVIPQRIIVSNNQQYSIKEIVEKLCKIAGFKGNIIWDTTKPNGQKSRPTDLTVLKSLIGDFEYTDIDEALKKSYEWFWNNPERRR